MTKGVTRRAMLLAGAFAGLASRAIARPQRRRWPDIIIYADVPGFGDLSCCGATGLRTPNLGRFAARGTRFLSAHSPSATGAPSRYALLTGDYAWRPTETHIVPGDAPALIRPGRFTLPAMLKRTGDARGVIGKWHLSAKIPRRDSPRGADEGPARRDRGGWPQPPLTTLQRRMA